MEDRQRTNTCMRDIQHTLRLMMDRRYLVWGYMPENMHIWKTLETQIEDRHQTRTLRRARSTQRVDTIQSLSSCTYQWWHPTKLDHNLLGYLILHLIHLFFIIYWSCVNGFIFYVFPKAWFISDFQKLRGCSWINYCSCHTSLLWLLCHHHFVLF